MLVQQKALAGLQTGLRYVLVMPACKVSEKWYGSKCQLMVAFSLELQGGDMLWMSTVLVL